MISDNDIVTKAEEYENYYGASVYAIRIDKSNYFPSVKKSEKIEEIEKYKTYTDEQLKLEFGDQWIEYKKLFFLMKQIVLQM